MLNVLHEQIDEVETVAAGCHILYSITHAEALKGPPPINLEEHLSIDNENSGEYGRSRASVAQILRENGSKSNLREKRFTIIILYLCFDKSHPTSIFCPAEF